MRILALSSWWPEPADNGSRLRIANLLRSLAREHEVHLVALSQGAVEIEQRERLEQFCATVFSVPQRAIQPQRGEVVASLWLPEPASVRATWNPMFDLLVQQRAAAIQPDLVIAFQLGVAPYARRVRGVPRVLEELEVTYILDQHADERLPHRWMRSWLTWEKHRRYVSRLLEDFAFCTVVSERERDAVLELAPHLAEVYVIPNGADVVGCETVLAQPEPDTLIYPGALSFEANRDAMAYFLRTSFPQIRERRPDTRLRITGRVAPAHMTALPRVAGVEFTGYVPDVRPLVAQSWCEVVPLRKGGGTRLKVLEALALGTPVIATSKGIEGLNLHHEQHVLVADTPAALTAATVRLLESPELRARLAAAGLRVIRQQYDWRVIGGQLNDLIRGIGGSSGIRHVVTSTGVATPAN